MSLGKDGTPWNRERWVKWAAAKESRSYFHVTAEHQNAARASAAKKLKRGGIRRPCVCGRMNPVAYRKCPACGVATGRAA